MRIQAISGFASKSPACFLVEIQNRRFLLDLGEGPQPGKFPDLSAVGPVDAILISHSHKDHIGGLHLAAQVGSPPVYATPMVQAVGGITARDLPLRGHVDLMDVDLETGLASHAPGGVWLRLGGESGVLYTGDWTQESPLYDIDPLPQARFMICDTSYGAYDTPIEDAFGKLLALAAQGPLLLPMPPAGRGLDAAILLSEAGCTISLCPAHRRVADRLLASKAGEIAATGRRRLEGMLSRAAPLDRDSLPRGVMLAGSADAAEGLASELVRRFAEAHDIRIAFTGFVADGTPGKQLIEEDRAHFIRWNVHPRARDITRAAERVRAEAVLPCFADLDSCRGLAKLFPEIPFVFEGKIG